MCEGAGLVSGAWEEASIWKFPPKVALRLLPAHILNIHHITIPFQLSWDQFNGIPIFVRQLLKERFCCCLFLRVSCFIFFNRCHGRAIQCNRDSARERCHQFRKKTRICHLPCFDFQVWMLQIINRAMIRISYKFCAKSHLDLAFGSKNNEYSNTQKVETWNHFNIRSKLWEDKTQPTKKAMTKDKK